SSSTPSFAPSTPFSTGLSNLNRPLPPLPPLRIEQFDGANITLWPSFQSQFNTIIGSRPDLSNLEKLNYLRSSLKGDALKLVQSIPIREDLYSQTIDRLKSAYDRSDHSTALLFQNLMGIKPKSPRVEDQMNCVRDMINLVYHINDAKNLDCLPLIEQIASHVHSGFVRQIWKLKPETILEALLFMERELREELELRAVENAFSCLPLPSIQPIPKQGNHETDKASKEKPERNAKIGTLRICRKCLTSGHNYADCPSKCAKCKEKHHESLCRSSNPSIPFNTTLQAAMTVNTPVHAHTRLFTSLAVIRNPDTGTASDSTVFLDGGSQISMISRDLANRLNLTAIHQKTTTVVGIGGCSNGPQTRDIVKFDLMTNTGVHSVEAMVTDGPIIPSMVVDSLPQSDIELLEEKSIRIPKTMIPMHTITPEILLGLDTTHALTKQSKTIQLPSGLQLVQCPLGPMVIGT
ncbi:hypothetical protein PFISCL1PPCAC_5356, partial [Pristionchus fissidentatus]